MSHPLPPKKEVALALLERSSVHVHLDPRAAGVVVPPWLKRQPQLVLQIGLNMPVPIPDLRLDESGLTCTLSFNRSPFYCVVPWTSVFAMVGDDGRGMVWPDDVPPEVAKPSQAQARPDRPAPAAQLAPVAKRSRRPAEASDGARDAESADGASATATGTATAKGAAKPKAKRAAKKRAGAGAEKTEGAERRSRSGAGAGAEDGRGDSSGRAVLVAVPAATDRKTPRDGMRDDRERDLRERGPSAAGPNSSNRSPAPAAAPAQSSGGNAGQSAGRRPTTSSRPKRELPPYLRVVK